MKRKHFKVLIFICLFVGMSFVFSGCDDETASEDPAIVYRVKVINMSLYRYDFMIYRMTFMTAEYKLAAQYEIGGMVGDSVPGFEVEVDKADHVRIKRQETDQWLMFGDGTPELQVNKDVTITINSDGTAQ